MKRILLASSALCLGTGMATAQDMMSGVTVSGDGRMGVVFDDNEDARFSSRVRVKFALAAELDGGMTAGGDIRADNAGGGTSGTAGKVFLSGPFGTLAMGDVDPGAKAALGHPAAVGYTEVGSMNEITYTRGSADGEEPALLYTLPKMGPVQAYASVGQEDEEVSFDTFSVGAKADLSVGDMGTAWIGAGFEGATGSGDEHVLVGAGASVSGFTGKLVAGMQDDDDQFGLSAGYSAGVIGATVFYTDDTDMDGNEALGVGLSWSLGGGASIVGGVATDIGQGENEDVRHADLGVTFSF